MKQLPSFNQNNLLSLNASLGMVQTCSKHVRKNRVNNFKMEKTKEIQNRNQASEMNKSQTDPALGRKTEVFNCLWSFILISTKTRVLSLCVYHRHLSVIIQGEKMKMLSNTCNTILKSQDWMFKKLPLFFFTFQTNTFDI